MAGFFRERGGGLELFVRLTPKAAADRIDGIETGDDGRSHLAIRVRALPERGAANAALERLLAETLGLPRSKVSVVAGHTARLKTVRLNAGADFVLNVLGGRTTGG
ncbi:DUF167 family protein [Kumtagia ephedrae]|jgi:uncharacterized protein YggU (UPF0235/DUF167 family)|uniref:UPF0235 protein C7I84_14640 n=1 Tax=Kumtagia ephedrae TaxID=2116701 RepID=A0A2P7S8C5_9HYPH|nr:DUF167 family protein [Mesorhizobium ephedrae]PSJ58717.1 hypothetical protein C7I84_14640 [Mesorhizobium ephedrae]